MPQKTSLKNVWVAVDYEKGIKELIHHYKYERGRTAATSLAMILDGALPYFTPDTLVTHVPTAPSRVRVRGYDHALLLAKEFAKIRGLKHRSLLGRVGESQQMGSKRSDRLAQAQPAYIGTKKISTKVLVVDDVLTTGATLMAVAKELRRSGATEVYGAVVAHHSN